MTPAARVAAKLCAALVAMPLSIVAAHLIDAHEAVEILCGVIFMLALACAFLYAMELRHALLDVQDAPWPVRALRAMIAVPQAIAGLVSLCLGLTIIGWVLYNNLVERQPAYSGGFLTFGVSSGLVFFGYALLRNAFVRRAPPSDHSPNRD